MAPRPAAAPRRRSFFHDAICVCTHGTPPKDPRERAAAIDICHNDIHLMVDDFIEADGGVHNIRVMRNRGFNAARHGLSAQPVFGGPACFYRNVCYNVPFGGAIKNGGANPAGVLVYTTPAWRRTPTRAATRTSMTGTTSSWGPTIRRSPCSAT